MLVPRKSPVQQPAHCRRSPHGHLLIKCHQTSASRLSATMCCLEVAKCRLFPVILPSALQGLGLYSQPHGHSALGDTAKPQSITSMAGVVTHLSVHRGSPVLTGSPPRANPMLLMLPRARESVLEDTNQSLVDAVEPVLF